MPDIECPACHKSFVVKQSIIGQRVKCDACNESFTAVELRRDSGEVKQLQNSVCYFLPAARFVTVCGLICFLVGLLAPMTVMDEHYHKIFNAPRASAKQSVLLSAIPLLVCGVMLRARSRVELSQRECNWISWISIGSAILAISNVMGG